jgi:hypothetical protein
MFNEYGVFKGLPKESLYLNINTDEAQRFLRANANIKRHNAKPIGSLNPSTGWLTEQQAGAIITKEVPDPPRNMPPGLRRSVEESKRETLEMLRKYRQSRP